MEIVRFCIVFFLIVFLLAIRRPLYQAISVGIIAIILFFKMPIREIWNCFFSVFTNWDSLSILISLYLICFLQRILDRCCLIKYAQSDLNVLFNNRRVNVAGSAMFIGLLPSAAAMILCGDIVKESTQNYLDRKEQAFATTWFRHVPESILPTYPAVLLMLNLSGVHPAQFMLGMLPPMLMVIVIGYFICLRKVPRKTVCDSDIRHSKAALMLVYHLWPLLLILLLILGFGVQVVFALLVSIIITLVVYRFKLKDIGEAIVAAFDRKLIVNTFIVLLLKEFISYTGVLGMLPETLSILPVPSFVVFATLFFVGGIISGSNGIIAIGTPLAFAAIPDGGAPLAVLLMGICHAASQVSPTHVCLSVAADYYGISLGTLIKKTLPAVLLLCLFILVYYLFLKIIV